MSDDISESGQGLRAVREAFDFSMDDVARAMKRSVVVVSAIERGRNDKYDIQAYAWALLRLLTKATP